MKSISIRVGYFGRKDGVLWYHHHHCGRSTTDTAEVVSYQVQSVDINGQMVSVLQEKWQDQDKRWTSIAIPKGDVNQKSLESHFAHIREWSEKRSIFSILGVGISSPMMVVNDVIGMLMMRF